MRGKSQTECLLTAKGRDQSKWTAMLPEILPAFFLLAGMLLVCRDLMDGSVCLPASVFVGWLAILALRVSEMFPKAARMVRMGIYLAGVLCFLGFILFVSQGFLDAVNRFRTLWNLRFRTELALFSVNSRAALGSLLFWALLAVPLAAFLRILVKKRCVSVVLMGSVAALWPGFVLGRSQMWLAALCLLAGIFGTLLFSAAPGRRYGFRSALPLAVLGVLFLLLSLTTGGYDGLSQIARWRADVTAWFGKLRYGEDTLPRGDLRKAPGLLAEQEETLRLTMEEPQEWYLRGFVGGDYDGSQWRELSQEAYQGEYEGLLQWLKTKDLSPLTQFAGYQKLTREADGSEAEDVRVEVENTGAYRKYVYLPSAAESWEGGKAQEKKDWQVRSGKFFGAKEYAFQAVSGAPSADEILLGAWVQKPSRKAEKDYLDAESVYHSFTEEYYMDVEEGLRARIEAMFFPEEEERDLNDVTAKIRRVLRQQTSYQEKPSAAPAGQDLAEWFLEDEKRGNAVHYATAAALAYRTAGYAARYVEGYHLTEEDARRLSEEGKRTAVLTNKNAHAWAEVYIPGAGWLPVETVPGMYTEMYTDQILEGAPAYQVNSDPGEDGLETEEGLTGAGESGPDEAAAEAWSPRRVFALLLFCLYLAFFLYLLLEIQRALRLARARRTVFGGGDRAYMDAYVARLWRLLLIGKVTGDYAHPMDLSAQVEEKLAGVSRGEYERVIELIQKVRFGGKELLPYELHTLDCFQKQVAAALAGQKGIWGKMKIRYLYAFDMRPERGSV